MKVWLLYVLFLLAGLGMFVAGIIYMGKEKSDPESVKIYRVVSVIGVVLAAGAVLYRFLN